MVDPTRTAAVAVIDPTGRVLLLAGDSGWRLASNLVEGDREPLEVAREAFAADTGVVLTRIRAVDPAATKASDGPLLFFADDQLPESVADGVAARWAEPADLPSLDVEPWTRTAIERLLASDRYQGTVAYNAPYRRGVAVLCLDRWGRVLLQLRDDDLPPERGPGLWSLAGGLIEEGEAPDSAALREFEEETGHVLDELKLYRTLRRDELPAIVVDVQHVYYIDADIPEDEIEVGEGQAFRYFGPGDIASLPMPEHSRTILEGFFVSPAYKGLFH